MSIDEGVDPRHRAVPRAAWRALAVGSAGYVLFGFNSTATNLAFGSIADTFSNVSESTVSWIASGYFVASAAFLPLGGRLADRLGRRRVFNVGLMGFAASALLSAVAPTVWLLIFARVAQAVAGALVIPSSLSMALPEFPAARRPSAVASWAAAGPLSAAIAPSAAAGLLGATSWRWVYFVSAPVALATLAASYVFVADSRGEDDEGRLDLIGTVLAVVAIALLIIGITQGPNWGWASPSTLAAIVAALAIGGIFTARSNRHPTPLLNLSLFRIPQVSIANAATFTMSVTSLSIWLVWPLWLIRVWGYSTSMVGLAITIGPLAAGPAALIGGLLADRYGQRWLMIIGTAISTTAVIWSIFRLGAEPDYLRTMMPTIFGFGLGWGLSNPSMNSYALSNVPQSVFGEVNAAFNTIRNLGAAIGTAGAIAFVGASDRLDVVDAYRRAYVFFAFWVGLSFVIVTVGTWYVERTRHDPVPPSCP
ncbi:MAG: MFS transporter [Actinomycetia bacterium]|nr:MFS transporter [Actinomycetes bacterium]